MKLKKEADRELAVLEKVSHLGMDNKSARSLTQAMLPLITCSVSRKKASKQNNITLRTLRCLTAVWATLAKGSHAFSREETRRYVQTSYTFKTSATKLGGFGYQWL